MTDEFNVPETLGACADLMYDIRQRRLDLQKMVDQYKKEEHVLREHIINELPKSEASGISGRLAKVKVVTKEVPVLKDREAFQAYIDEHDLHHLAQTLKPSAAAVKEFWKEGDGDIPGIEKFVAVDVSLTKA